MEIVQFGILFAVTIVFSMIALTMDKTEYKILTKMIAGTCWVIMAVSQYISGDISSGLTLASALIFAAFSFFYYFATALDWLDYSKSKSFGSKRKMGVFD